LNNLDERDIQNVICFLFMLGISLP